MSIPSDHPYDFDPAHGLEIDGLRAIRPPPASPEFEAFWQERHARALAVDPHPQLKESGSQGDWRIFDLSFSSTGDFTIGGWLLLPHEGPIRRGLVVGHGYGGREEPDFDIPVRETVLLFPCFRGLSRSRHPPISTEPAWHVLHDIDKPDHYILGGCVEDLWVAVSVLQVLYPGLEGIGYSGISFGGGIGALAIGFDKRIDRGHLIVPTFGNMPLWLSLPTIGSGHSVQAYQQQHPEVRETLKLFDAATATTRITQPMLMAVARFDPVVAPPCQFSIANAISSKGSETVILDAGHCDYAGSAEQHASLRAKVAKFFETASFETT